MPEPLDELEELEPEEEDVALPVLDPVLDPVFEPVAGVTTSLPVICVGWTSHLKKYVPAFDGAVNV